MTLFVDTGYTNSSNVQEQVRYVVPYSTITLLARFRGWSADFLARRVERWCSSGSGSQALTSQPSIERRKVIRIVSDTLLSMNIYRIVATAALALPLVRTGKAQSARDYFNELYKAGGLDRMADEYVCFDNSPELQTFFIFAKSDVLKQFLMDNGGFAKLPKSQQSVFSKGFLIVRGYHKG